ncbi:MAG: copper chaperone PCu(A)C [Dehalococcoidia bacterium]|nr:copper chaperone PCu(A)C [Dehalococcoidia bacterium]
MTRIDSTARMLGQAWRGVALAALLGVALVTLIACSDDGEGADVEDSTTTATAAGTPAATETATATEATETATETATASAGEMEVTEVWARATAGNEGENTAIYATIVNGTGEDDTLVAASVGDVAAMAEIHEMVEEGENMVMREVEGGLPIPSGATTSLEPGGYHVMVMDVAQQLNAGDAFDAVLTFEHAGDIEVRVEVRPVTEGAGGMSGGMGG